MNKGVKYSKITLMVIMGLLFFGSSLVLAADNYKIDSAHSTLGFEVTH